MGGVGFDEPGPEAARAAPRAAPIVPEEREKAVEELRPSVVFSDEGEGQTHG